MTKAFVEDLGSFGGAKVIFAGEIAVQEAYDHRGLTAIAENTMDRQRG